LLVLGLNAVLQVLSRCALVPIGPQIYKTFYFNRASPAFLRKGEVLAYVGRIHNLKDLKAWSRGAPTRRSIMARSLRQVAVEGHAMLYVSIAVATFVAIRSFFKVRVASTFLS